MPASTSPQLLDLRPTPELLVSYWAHRAWPPRPRAAHRIEWYARQGRVSPVAWRRALRAPDNARKPPTLV